MPLAKKVEVLQMQLLCLCSQFLHCRFMTSSGHQYPQQQQQSPQHHQQQQQFTFQDTYWDPLNDDSQGFKFGPSFGHGFNDDGQG